MTDYPPLTESEVQAEKARHSKSSAGEWCSGCHWNWPCLTIRLIAERERFEEGLHRIMATNYQPGQTPFQVEQVFHDLAYRTRYPAALAETGGTDA